MPLIYVQRYAPTVQIIEGGTQYLENDAELRFTSSSPKTNIVLSNDVFGATGDYVLFDYSAGSFPNPAQLSNVTVDTSGLILSGDYTLTDDPANSRVILSLKSRSTNGTQYVDGNLDIAATLTMILSSALYATAGEYILFEVAAGKTISPASAGNISLVVPPGRSIAVPPYVPVSGNQIKVTLA